MQGGNEVGAITEEEASKKKRVKEIGVYLFLCLNFNRKVKLN